MSALTLDRHSAAAVSAEKLARMVALSETFQSGDDLPTAEARVYRRNVVDVPRPYAVVAQGQLPTWTLVAGGSQNYFRPAGELFLYLARDTEPAFYDDLVRAEDAAADWFNGVIEDLVALAAADDPESFDNTSHLSIVRVQPVLFDETSESDWQSLGRFFFAAYTVAWGDGT